MTFYTGGSERVRVDTSGNVGIGTSSPSARLHVYQDSASTSVMSGTYIQNVSFTTNSQAGIGFFAADNFNAKIYTLRSGSSAGNIVFATNGGGGTAETNIAERARIDSSGRLLVGRTSNTDSATLQLSNEAGGANIAMLAVANTTGDSYPCIFRNPNGQIGAIKTNGSSTAYNTSSDYRLKEDIQPMTGALAKVAALKPCTYKWKADGSDGEGFIAHELQAVVPQCVTGEKDAVDVDGNPQYQGIDTSFLVATLTAAIKEQQAIITALTARVNALESN
jgi:hypothetical protein